MKNLEEALSTSYIIPGFLNMQGVVNGEKLLAVKPLTEALDKYSSKLNNLTLEECKAVVDDVAAIYDLNAAGNGTLTALKMQVCNRIDSKLMEIEKRSNPFFSAPTGDIRDIFTVKDVEDILEVSKIFYNKPIKDLIEANKERLIKEYLAKEIQNGLYIFTRAGVQFLLDKTSKTLSTPPAVTVKVEPPKPVIAMEEPSDIDTVVTPIIPEKLTFDLVEGRISKEYWRSEVNVDMPLNLNMANYDTLCHKSDDYRMAFINILWFYRPYNSLPYFFANNLAGVGVWAAQTRSFVICIAAGLKRALRGYYAKFIQTPAKFMMADFMKEVKDDFGVLQGRHTLKYNDDTLNDVIIFDKRAIMKYIMKHKLHKNLPFFGATKKGTEEFLDPKSRRFNKELTMPGFIDLGNSDCYKQNNTSISSVGNELTTLHFQYGYETEFVVDEPVLKEFVDPKLKTEVAKDSLTLPIPAPLKGTYEEVAYNTTKPIFLSNVVEWVVENSTTDSEEMKKIGEVYKAITKYASPAVAGKYASVKVLAEAIHDFDYKKNNVVFTPKSKK